MSKEKTKNKISKFRETILELLDKNIITGENAVRYGYKFLSVIAGNTSYEDNLLDNYISNNKLLDTFCAIVDEKIASTTGDEHLLKRYQDRANKAADELTEDIKAFAETNEEKLKDIFSNKEFLDLYDKLKFKHKK
ncbi:hypothetical protein [Clostridium sp.]|jgi:hypothetical protein|uniref:hypothetical protein n=1 Tax=Clostridium sp. TaxID=1506 RepID=UPI00258DBE00|nr:hypothetical protein [Clostridium sp.]MDF2505746.1 hypothetical protein [Clostridium sp.]